MKKTLVLVAVTLGLAACNGNEDTATTLHPDTVIHFAEEDNPVVYEIVIDEPQLFRTHEEWSAWYAAEIPGELKDLPDGMREPEFDDSVAVAGSFYRCVEYPELRLDATEISFHVLVPEGREGTDCAHSPNQIYVLELSTQHLGIDADDLTIDPEYQD